MAITPISNRYEGFIFNGENSRTYGVYITEPAVFDAPERDVEMVSVPGRNGDYILDNGKWRNIQVTYHCALPTKDEADFIQGVQDFRNMLASNIGYQRLEDEINTDEYRMGAFLSGLAVDTINKEAGTFDVVFNCQPYRFLKSGETAVAVTSGDTLTNPTLYEAKPLLDFYDYGTIEINGEEINVSSSPLGLVTLSNAYSGEWVTLTGTAPPDTIAKLYTPTTLTNSGDYISIAPREFSVAFTFSMPSVAGRKYSAPWYTEVDPDPYLDEKYNRITSDASGNRPIFGAQSTSNLSFFAGQMGDYTTEQRWYIGYEEEGGASGTYEVTLSENIIYGGGDTLEAQVTYNWHSQATEAIEAKVDIEAITAESTVSVEDQHVFIDLETGEAYADNNGAVISVNNVVELPTQLPTLKPGNNTIEYTGVSAFKVTPRWVQL